MHHFTAQWQGNDRWILDCRAPPESWQCLGSNIAAWLTHFACPPPRVPLPRLPTGAASPLPRVLSQCRSPRSRGRFESSYFLGRPKSISRSLLCTTTQHAMSSLSSLCIVEMVQNKSRRLFADRSRCPSLCLFVSFRKDQPPFCMLLEPSVALTSSHP